MNLTFRTKEHSPDADKFWLPYKDDETEGVFLNIYNSSKQLVIPWGRGVNLDNDNLKSQILCVHSYFKQL